MVKDILREIKGRKLQFLAILLITTLGVGFFIGIRVTGHDMRLTANEYMKTANVLDLQIMNSYGIDKEMKKDLDDLLKEEGYETFSSNIYAESNHFDGVLNLYEINESTINDLTLEEGSMPKAKNEIFIDSLMADVFNVKLNDTIKIKENEVFEKAELKVVAIGKSSLYLNRSRGHTNLGSGVIDGYAYAYDLDTKIDTATSLRYVFADDADVDKKIKILESNEEELLKKRFDRLIEPKKKELKEAEEALAQAKADFEIEISNQRHQIALGEQTLKSSEAQLHVSLDQLTFNIPTAGTLDERLDLVTRGFEAVKDLSQKSIDDLEARIQTIENELIKEELQAQLDKQLNELNTMVVEFENGRAQVESGILQYNSGLAELEAGKIELENGIEKANQEFAKAEKEIENEKKQLEEADKGTLFIFG